MGYPTCTSVCVGPPGLSGVMGLSGRKIPSVRSVGVGRERTGQPIRIRLVDRFQSGTDFGISL